MILSNFFENLKSLSDLEVYSLMYLTGKNWYFFKNADQDEIKNVLMNAFKGYFGTPKGEDPHPFFLLYQKITDGVNMDDLIYDTDSYGSLYRHLATCVNKLYTSDRRGDVEIILNAFKERDFEEICGIYQIHDKDSIDYTMVAQNLDEVDLETILTFCGSAY